jgi:fructose-bisphosphate aldolase class I
MIQHELQKTIELIAQPGKGILAADESTGTIKKRFDSRNIECTENSRRDYRELLLAADQVEDYISGVILFDETLRQSTKAGQKFSEVLKNKKIAVGIKVDKGPKPLPFFEGETITEGLDGLAERLIEYKALGAQFAKWRAVLSASKGLSLPTCHAIHVNADALARYAAVCQSVGIVPMVEPEILMDGDHDIDYSLAITTNALRITFEKLAHYHVALEHIILKPNMVVSGANCSVKAGVEEVAEKTLLALKRTVPAAVPSINFLSGGQSDELAIKAWAGHAANVAAAQKALLKRAKLNSLAALGKYCAEMESQ